MEKNKQLINWDFYEGKTFRELSSLEKAIIRTLKFDWIMRPVTPDTKTDYKFVWRFGEDNKGFYLEADMANNKDANELIRARSLNSRDVLTRLTSPFRICNDSLENDSVLGDYNG